MSYAALGTGSYYYGDFAQTSGTWYGYDARGLERYERELSWGDWHWLKLGAASWDALGRMTSWSDTGTAGPPASVSWSYDAAGNIREQQVAAHWLDDNGAAAQDRSRDDWFTYDAMNRVVIADGTVSGGQVVRGDGESYGYDADGERVSETQSTVTTVFDPYETSPTDSSVIGWWRYETGERDTSYVYDAAGAVVEVIRRDETSASGDGSNRPHEIWYRFGGREIGTITNDGRTLDEYASYGGSDGLRELGAGTGPFTDGEAFGENGFRFGASPDPIDSYAQGSAAGTVTVRAGDTLSSIAGELWGDGSLWYRLAQANGLSGDGGLTAGQTLTIPAGVMRASNNAATYRPYDAGGVVGDLSPTGPQPQAPAQHNGCGVFGAILLAVVAVAVTALTFGTLGPVGSALVGDAASQTVGVGAGLSSAIHVGGIGGALLRGTASDLAGAAARSLIDGTDFGDTVIAALPDAIGQTVGDAIAGAIARRGGATPAAAGDAAAYVPRSPIGEVDLPIPRLTAADLAIDLPALPDLGGAGATAIVAAGATANAAPGPVPIDKLGTTGGSADGGSKPYPVNADLSGLSLRQLQAARYDFVAYAQGQGFTDYDQRLAAFDTLAAQATVREAPGQALADANTNEVLRSVLPPLDFALSLGAIGRGNATVSDYVTIGASILPGVLKAGGVIAKVGAASEVAADSAGVDLALTYKPGWSVAQRAEADLKVQTLTEGDTVVIQSARSGTSAAGRYRNAGNQITLGNDIDHAIDLQLGGSDTVSNMWPLNTSVNRSLGVQIQQQIKNLPHGTVINKVTIGER